MHDNIISLWSLFASAFLSATLLPGSSEILLAYLFNSAQHSTTMLIAVATVGNTLGGFTSYWIGRFLANRYPTKTLHRNHQVAIARIRNWGSFSLLLSWVPIIGDPLCVAAGYLKLNAWIALLLLALGKAARYDFVILMTPAVLAT